MSSTEMSNGEARQLSAQNPNLKVLVGYSIFTGEMEVEGLFITTLRRFTDTLDIGFTLHLNIIDHHSMVIEVENVIRICSTDQELIEKLELAFGANICGKNLFERIDEEIEEDYVDDAPREERADAPGTIMNSIGMKFVPIPSGTFKMFDEDHAGQCQHEVSLSKSFHLGMTQVTQSQYEQVMGNNPSYFQGYAVAERDSSEFPVERISWDDAVEFCRRLSELPEEKKAGRIYRLPTEAEWEYACRAGSDTQFSYGDDYDYDLADQYCWFKTNSGVFEAEIHGDSEGNRPHPVALKKPNAWGLYDMHGNVWEWCSDWYGEYAEGAITDPLGPETPQKWEQRVSRGGGFGDDPYEGTSAGRGRRGPSWRLGDQGFRVALSSPSGIPKSPEAGK